MRLRGFEPPRSFEQYDLNVSRLPVPPQPHETPNLSVALIGRGHELTEHMFVRYAVDRTDLAKDIAVRAR
jgi:hypothetical protein